jgi:hypothetical protein
MLRSLVAVGVGYLVMATAVIVLFTFWFHKPGTAPTENFLLFSLVYGFAAAFAGGYVTALIARHAELKHAAALAGVSVLLGVLSMIMSSGLEPRWSQVVNMVIAATGVLLGGYTKARRMTKVKG